MRNSTIQVVVLSLIFLLAFLLRFYHLGSVPNGLQQDETSIGYNAYSILLTGKDEHGVFFPQNFQAFGEYKLPGYIYAAVPSVALFGLTPFGIRFIAALSGFLTVVVAFFLTKKILPYFGADGSHLRNNPYLPLLTAFLLAINPWSLHFSRGAFEVTLANFFLVMGIWMFLKAVESRKLLWFLLAAVMFAGSMYTYNIARLFVPVFVAGLLYLFRKQLFGVDRRSTFLFLVAGAILLIPFIIGIIIHGGADSTTGTLIFSSAKVQAPLREFRSYFAELPVFINKLLLNSWALTVWQYIQNIIASLSTSFFFLRGSGNGIDSIGTTGQWYVFEFPCIILGAILLLRKSSMAGRIIFFWIAGVILVSALTREPPQATRTFFLTYPVTFLSALGLIRLVQRLRGIKYRSRRLLFGITLGLIACYAVVLYFLSYYIRFPIDAAGHYRTGDRDVTSYLMKNAGDYNKILIDKKAGLIYTSVLTYLHYPPSQFQKETKWSMPDSEGFTYPLSFGKYEIRDIDWTKDVLLPKTLIITSASNKPNEITPTETIYYPLRPVVINIGQEIMQFPVRDIAYQVIATKRN